MRYLIGVGLVAISAIGLGIVLWDNLSREAVQTQVTDASGLQRQQIKDVVIYATDVVAAATDEDRLKAQARLAAAAAEFLRVHESLVAKADGAANVDPHVQQILDIYFEPEVGIDPLKRQLAALALAIAERQELRNASARRDFVTLRDIGNRQLPEKLDSVAALRLASIEARIHRTRLLILGGVAALLAVILASGVFIFRPMLHEVVSRERALKARNAEIEAKNLLITLADAAAGLGHWRLDLTEKTVFWSEQVFRIHGVDPQNGPPSLFEAISFYHPDDRDRIAAYVEASIKRQEPMRFEARIQRPDGEIRHVASWGVCEYDDEGCPVAVSGVFQDVTDRAKLTNKLRARLVEVDASNRALDAERQRLEAVSKAWREARDEAAAANTAKSQFIASMSHELRTPLNAVIGFAEMLELMSDSLSPKERAEYAGYVRRGGQHLLQLIQELLDLSKIEAGRLTINPEPVSIGHVLADIVASTERQAADRGISVGLKDDVGDRMVAIADPMRLRQSLINLISNAVKYNRDGGRVDIEAEMIEGDRIRIAVRDTGRGIDPKLQGELFQPFNRLGADRSGIEGTGIGLAITKALVEAMDGQIGVSSVVGKGSTFWISLPGVVEHAAAQSSIASDDEAQRLQRRLGNLPPARILYVDDATPNIALIQHFIGKVSQLTLITADSEAQGFAAALDNPPDVILTDLKLSEGDGFGLHRRLLAEPRTAGIPVVAVTADAMEETREQVLQSGFAGYLSKPLSLTALTRCLSDILALDDDGRGRDGGADRGSTVHQLPPPRAAAG